MKIWSFVGSIKGGSNRNCEVRVNSEDDVPQAADALLQVFHDFAEPYFERFSALSTIDSELNEKPREETPNRIVPWLWCATGSIVARLVDRPNYGDLAEVYLDTMRTSNKGF